MPSQAQQLSTQRYKMKKQLPNMVSSLSNHLVVAVRVGRVTRVCFTSRFSLSLLTHLAFGPGGATEKHTHQDQDQEKSTPRELVNARKYLTAVMFEFML